MFILTRIKQSITRRPWGLLSLRAAARRLTPNYRLTWDHLDWWENRWFNDYLDRFGARRGFNTQRHWTLWQFMRFISSVEGDTAECGVFEGASSWLMCAGNGGRTHHLFDSFEGLSAPGKDDGGWWRPGDLAAGEDLVRGNLEVFLDRCVFHKGWIPDTFQEVADRKFAAVHIDVDLYQPTFDSIAFFYPRLSLGAVLICDDYGFQTCPGATKAIDEFLAGKPEKMIRLDSGGGLMIKGVQTAEERVS
jgi:O-methyltransferase